MSTASRVVLGHRYELDERIGAGGYSEVWRAADLVLDRPVAIKLLHAGFAQHTETLTRFRSEARHSGRLSHENIARVYDYGEPEPPHPPFLVLELIPGLSLAEVLTRGALDPARSIEIVAQAAAGLHAAHQAGLVHRDIKPGNLLIGPEGVVKITDFGISHVVGSAPLTGTGMLFGTPGYIAPERLAEGPATPASDLYSLGIVAYECLVGAAPFTGTALEVALAHRDRPLPPLPASVPAGVAVLVGELTAKDPGARPASAARVAGRAAELAERMGAGANVWVADASAGHAELMAERTGLLAATSARPRRRGSRRLGRRAALGAAAVVVLIAGLATAREIGSKPPQHAAAGPSPSAQPESSAVPLVEVTDSSLVGRPVSAVVRRLRQQGLVVRVHWQVTGRQSPGTVLSIRPAGRRPVGSPVTVVGALGALGVLKPAGGGETSPGGSQPPGTGQGHGHGNGHTKGKGKDKGKDKGKGKGHGKG